MAEVIFHRKVRGNRRKSELDQAKFLPFQLFLQTYVNIGLVSSACISAYKLRQIEIQFRESSLLILSELA